MIYQLKNHTFSNIFKIEWRKQQFINYWKTWIAASNLFFLMWVMSCVQIKDGWVWNFDNDLTSSWRDANSSSRWANLSLWRALLCPHSWIRLVKGRIHRSKNVSTYSLAYHNQKQDYFTNHILSNIEITNTAGRKIYSRECKNTAMQNSGSFSSGSPSAHYTYTL